ncbi:MAG: acetyl-CoA carboxylase biotin carboxyl carrier protein subunit [Deltaproteobacteria bacterium]|nr:acetyl-CoA carboxylase biotin carboxyl carrier protein subunit [Deltaproteobacteria bacterium]
MAYRAELDEQTYLIDVQDTGGRFTVGINGETRTVDSRRIGSRTYSLLIDGRSHVADVACDGDQYTVSISGQVYKLRLADERRYRAVELGHPEEEVGGRREIRAQIPGKVVEVLVRVGDQVTRDQGVMTIEAMKMENEIKAPATGEVQEILVQPGQAVEAGALLAVIAA